MDENLRLGKEIIEGLGGKENIRSIMHCSTRIRCEVIDKKAVDKEVLKKIKGVQGVVDAIGNYQIVVGTNAKSVLDEIQKEYGLNYTEEEDADRKLTWKEIPGKIVGDIAACVAPVIPALIASGLINAFLTLGVRVFHMPTDSNTYAVFKTVTAIATYFMPVFVANAAAKRFGCSPTLAIFMACLSIHPNIAGIVGAGEKVTLFGLPMYLTTYTATLFPAVFTTWVLSKVEKWLRKVLPQSLHYVPVPVLTVLIMTVVMFVLTGPIGAIIGSFLASIGAKAYAASPILGRLTIGLLSPFLTLTGSHLALIPFSTNNFVTLGYDNFMYPSFIAINLGMVGIALAVMLKTKSKSLKQTALGAMIAGATGISEPGLYGLCVKLKKPFVALMLTTIANAIWCAIFNVRIFTQAGPSFLTIPIFIDPNGSNNFLFAIGAYLVVLAVSFTATWLLGFEDPIDED